MSLVGPRPLPVAEASAVSGIGKVRELVKPGLTCIWQVSGRNNIDFEEWMKLDALYVRKHNLWIDFKLMIQTIPAVLLTKGAS
jgi:lipopolysaccharide/colanic/teichoic acid biosynthesis glycosyltransferase